MAHAPVQLSSRGGDFLLEARENPGACQLLFYPGTMACPRQYDVLLDALREAGFGVWGLHLAGHGQSPRRRIFSPRDLVENGLAAERWILSHAGSQLVLAGHSQGAILTLAHAAAGTKARRAFALAGILPQLPETLDLTLFGFLKSRRRGLEKALSLASTLCPALPVPPWGYLPLARLASGARPLRIPGKDARRSYPLAFLKDLLAMQVPAKAGCPLTLVFARDDRLFTPGMAVKLHGEYLAAGQDAELCWIPGGGHLFPFNRDLAGQTASLMAAKVAASGLHLCADAGS
ncbi:MAG: alpha/beta fold hydrolase [Desulfovibrio sp.]|jgi:pimeloyl-ACP methyl ester carboxylesterase|nr:alpha/beta fold hydrolase [Desulfovibrio sp.]MBQ1845612.1 alpha/beta fold hydrolase [Desulfovibrio sp.]MBQ2476074.1 alpha/beta fold hydrolase [Desulfovibrio sp.]MCR5169472.1 lysophospholipase [Desulfovibrio sp.]